MPFEENRFGRVLDWLRNALQLQGAHTPQELYTGTLIPTIDALQGGWGVATYETWRFDRAAGTAGGNEQLIGADPTATRIILAWSGDHGGGAAATRLLAYIDIVGSAGGIALFSQLVGNNDGGFVLVGPQSVTPAAGEVVGIMSSWAPLIIPPNYTLNMTWPTTAAGEDFTTSMVSVKLPAGVKPI